MGKDEVKGGDIKTSKSVKQQQSKLYRKTVLGSNTLALFLTPSSSNGQINPAVKSRGQFSSTSESCSPHTLFNMIKEVNRYMVKGTKLYESLKELRLCGWVSPLTLLLTGPAEDMKVLKHAWIKRHLKNPLGYYIKDVGIVQEFVVELLPQSPFMSLKTALFDAVADLNNQSIFPTKENLREYLRKHYPDVKLPEIRHVHECLGRLVKERRLYHNGCGYFILCNINVLNELKMFNNEIPDIQCQSSAESAVIKGFALSSSSSPAATELEINSSSVNNTSNSAAETSSIERAGFPSFLESNRNTNNDNPVRSFFKKHVKTGKKQCPNEETVKAQMFDKCVGLLDINALQSDKTEKKDVNCNVSPVFIKREHSNVSPAVKRDKMIGNKQKNEKANVCKSDDFSKKNKHETKGKSKYVSNDIDNCDRLGVDSKVHFTKCEHEVSINNDEESTNNLINAKSGGKEVVAKRKSKLNRSHSFDGKVGKTQKDVTFAIVGVPCNSSTQKSIVSNEHSHFKRSHSFGAGSSRKFKKPQDDTNLKLEPGSQKNVEETIVKSSNSDGDTRDIPPIFYHDGDDDDVDNSHYCSDNLRENNIPNRADMDHSPDLLYNYEDLGSAISFHKNNLTHYTVMDLSSPPVASSLAGELQEVCYGQYI